MYARMTSYDIQPGRVEERLRHSAERSRPALRAVPGFRGLLVLVDRDAHRNVSIIFWESEAEMLASEVDPEFWPVTPQQHFAAGDVTSERFDVLLYERTAVPAAHARTITYLILPGQGDKLLQYVVENTGPIRQRQPGRAGHILLFNQSTNKLVMLSLWGSAEAAAASERDPAFAGARARHRFATSDVSTENFEVAHQE
jgi:heme-degrading monooxygenase HmoA